MSKRKTIMTALFSWNKSFVTGIPSVDEQHRRLVDLINDLGEQITSTDEIDAAAFVKARDAILEYTQVHFSDEESQMTTAGVDSRHCTAHKKAHRAFLAEALSLSHIGETLSLEQVRELVDYLVHWLAYHILGMDQSMARQIHAIHAGQLPAQAFDDDATQVSSGTEPLLIALQGLFQTVSQRNRELRTLNNELEERVKQRTAELEYSNRQLQMLSTQDELTGLPNRRFAVLSLKQLWENMKRYGNRLSLLLIDADYFKQVNDTYGHPEGDAVLRELSARLRNTMRNSDIVCRLGGDEFLIICPNTSLSGASEAAQKILAARKPLMTAEDVECWNGSVSIGVAEATSTMAHPNDLMQAADQALYVAKREGRGRMACQPG